MNSDTSLLWWATFSQAITGLSQAAGIFIGLWLWLNRRQLRESLKTALPCSLRFNLLIFTFDAGLILLPLTYVSSVTQQAMREHGLVLLDGRHLAPLYPLLVIVLALFVGDGIAYFRHRLEHSRWLWSAHVMHHSDTDLNWTSVYRIHPINRLTTVIIDYGSLAMLGFPPYAIVANAFFRSYYGMFIHTRLPWTYGSLGTIFVSPAMHRWHHVREGQGVGTNFATIFAVFDRLFGTYYLPGPCEEPLGVSEVDNDSFIRQMALPFVRLRSFFIRKNGALTPERASKG